MMITSIGAMIFGLLAAVGVLMSGGSLVLAIFAYAAAGTVSVFLIAAARMLYNRVSNPSLSDVVLQRKTI